MIEMRIEVFGIFLFLSFCGAICLVSAVYLTIKEKKSTKNMAKGGVILLGGYQPTEENATQPPNCGSGVQPIPPKSGTNAQHINFDENPVEKWCLNNAGIKKNKLKVFISPETARKIIKKKSIPRFQMLLTPLRVTADTWYSRKNDKGSYITIYRCPTCDVYLRRKMKRCFKCSQALDWEGVSENG